MKGMKVVMVGKELVEDVGDVVGVGFCYCYGVCGVDGVFGGFLNVFDCFDEVFV